MDTHKKTIYLAYHFVQGCNFKCSYCIDPINREQVNFSPETNFHRFLDFVLDIISVYPNASVDISLIWWEPLIDVRIFDLIDLLVQSLSPHSLRIQIVTNGLSLSSVRDKINHSPHRALIHFRITYHLQEYIVRDPSWYIFLESIKMLCAYQISFQIVFLLPNDFHDLKKIQDIVLWLQQMSVLPEKAIKFELLKNISQEVIRYDPGILEVYDQILQSTGIIQNKPDYGAYLLWSSKLRGYRCFPFRAPTFIVMNFDLSVQFGRCKTLSQKYSLDWAIDQMRTGSHLWVECQDDVCPCGVLSEIYKEQYCELVSVAPKLNQAIEWHGIDILKCAWVRNSYGKIYLELVISYLWHGGLVKILSSDDDEGVSFGGLRFSVSLSDEIPDHEEYRGTILSCIFRLTAIFEKLIALKPR